MKKFIALVFLLFSCALILYANPIMPVYISEISFDDNGDWTIELYDYYQLDVRPNLDDCYIESSTNLAYFNNGIAFTVYDTLLVTNDDMQTDLIINREGDCLMMQGDIFDEIKWGTYPYSHVNAPLQGQSLARIVLSTDDYFLVKENQPTLGYNPFDVQTFGSLDGIVTYNNGVPVDGAEVSFHPLYYGVITDEYGYFNISGIYGMNYDLIVTLNDTIIIDTIITVEPEGTTYVELSPGLSIDPQSHHETITVSNHPNPFYNETQIHYSLPHNSAGLVTIFNSKGQKIRKIPVSPTENSISWSGMDEHNKKVPSGVYFYRVECENKRLASGKMLYLR